MEEACSGCAGDARGHAHAQADWWGMGQDSDAPKAYQPATAYMHVHMHSQMAKGTIDVQAVMHHTG